MTLRNRTFVILLVLAAALGALAFIYNYSRGPTEVAQSPAALPQASPAIQTEEMPGSLQADISRLAKPEIRGELDKLYAESEYRPLWTQDKAGRRRLAATEEIAAVLAAQGLDSTFLAHAKSKLIAATSDEERVRAELDMTAAVLRAAHGQRFGFLSAQALGWNVTADTAEIAPHLGEALVEQRLGAFFRDLQPQHRQFASLTDALAKYRQIEAAGGWQPIAADREVDLAGDARIPALRARLGAEGYLSGGADDAALLEAVKLFQTRNGLEPDGRVGRGTLNALNVPVEQRIEQIVANLERWRHMRHQEPEEYVLANIADQTVAVIRNGREDLRLRTVVGAKRHATPILEVKMTAVTLNPAWEIPTSIITNEILPKLDQDPYYLMDNGMEHVSGDWQKPKSLRIRQRPGVGNSLGQMKFQMQNQWNIYLHDTPSRALFATQDRYHSHGCVRVDQPQQLAANLLSGWTPDELNEAIATGETRTIKLEKPLPVFVLYWTVFADQDGNLNFRRDAYDRDAQTVAGLSKAGLLSSQVVEIGN